MEHLTALLNELEQITLADISDLPEDNQHIIAERLEQLQDDLKNAIQTPTA